MRSAIAPGPELIRIELLGSFRLIRGGGPPQKLPKKAQTLLAFLATRRGRSFSRDELATLLWGESATEQARQSLRHCLSSLRQALGSGSDGILITDNDSAQLSDDARLGSDLADFERLCGSTHLDDLETAAALCRGEFLAGLHIAEAACDDWMRAERERLASLRAGLLHRLAATQAESGDVGRASETALQLIQLDPLREEGHRMRMRMLAAQGNRGAALKQYEACVKTLRDELGLSPEDETKQLAAALRADTSFAAPVAARPPHTPERSTPGTDKPSLVVLPFANLSETETQDYFVDGLTEDVTIALGCEKWLFVIASASAFAMKASDPLAVGRSLGVRYVLRGSVRRSANRVRIVAQLIDAEIGGHLWAERFEDEADNIFAMQDRVAAQVAAMIAPALRSIEIERARRKPPENLSAYEFYLRALPLGKSGQRENAQALAFLRQAVKLDPSFAAAYGFAARCCHIQRMMGWVLPDDPILQNGVELARLAIMHGAADSEALWMAGLALANITGDVAGGLHWVDKSLALNPNSANAWIASCFLHAFLNEPQAALESFARAQRLNPIDTTQHIQCFAAGLIHFIAGRYDEAQIACDQSLKENSRYPGSLRLKIALCGLLSGPAEAGLYIERLIEVNPNASQATIAAYWKGLLDAAPLAREAFLLGLGRAGFRAVAG